MVHPTAEHSIAIVGGGITGLAAAQRLTRLAGNRRGAVVLFEGNDRIGGKISSTAFAGLDGVDEGADAFLARVPDASALAVTVGLEVSLIHPEPVGAAVWYDELHPIPDGLMLGVPGRIRPMASSGLLSWRGKLRAAIEPLLPRTSLSDDSIGSFVRARFGDEVHERLVDALVGSIYATDTDRFSLAEVPQLHALAAGSRSVLVGARRSRATPGTATAAAGPIFAAPRGGLGALTAATAEAVRTAGGSIRLGTTVEELSSAGNGWIVNGERFDAVLLATPPSATANLVRPVAPAASDLLEQAESSDVVLVTLHIASDEWPDRLAGLSGYLVPKPVQRWVTAASFGSQKWAHWKPPAGGQILRVSLGRDGRPVLHLTDEEIVGHVLADLSRHLGVEFSPLEVRISRWPGAFAQYRPHHSRWVDSVESALPAGLFVAGAGYRGIGIPACIRQGTTFAERAAEFTNRME